MGVRGRWVSFAATPACIYNRKKKRIRTGPKLWNSAKWRIRTSRRMKYITGIWVNGAWKNRVEHSVFRRPENIDQCRSDKDINCMFCKKFAMFVCLGGKKNRQYKDKRLSSCAKEKGHRKWGSGGVKEKYTIITLSQQHQQFMSSATKVFFFWFSI